MKVAYSSLKEFQKLKPCPKTVVISLTGNEPEITELEPNGWAKFLSTKFDILRPEGPSGSFKPMDDQAKKLATELYPRIKDADNVIVQCEYGEIRSVAVATGIAYSDIGDSELLEIKESEWITQTQSPRCTFSARTYSWISRTIDKLHEEATK